MQIVKVAIVSAALLVMGVLPRAADQVSIAYWSADDLKSGHVANMPFLTATHAFNVLRVRTAEARMAVSHEGTSDIQRMVIGRALL